MSARFCWGSGWGQAEGKLSDFWPKIKGEYLSMFPLPGQENVDELDQAQKEELAMALKRTQDVSIILFSKLNSIVVHSIVGTMAELSADHVFF